MGSFVRDQEPDPHRLTVLDVPTIRNRRSRPRSECLLFSLQHGFVWFAPLALVGISGWLFCDRGKERIVAALALAATAAWFCVAAAWVGWEGGSCYGPRLLVPVIPIAGAGLYPLLRRFRRARFIAIAATLAGVVVNGAAAIDPFTAFWEASAIALVIKNPAVWIVVAAFGTLAYFGFLRAPAQGDAQLSR